MEIVPKSTSIGTGKASGTPHFVSATQPIEQGLSHLSRLPRLETLDLRYMGLDGVDVSVLNTPNLRKLNVDTDRNREEIKRLRKQIPRLDPVTTERIMTRAEIVGESSFWNYDFLSNQMKVEID